MSGCLIDSGSVRSTANEDLNDSDELRGCRTQLGNVEGYARDATDLQQQLESFAEVYRAVFTRFGDALEALGYAQHPAADNYDSTEATNSSVYSRLGGGGAM